MSANFCCTNENREWRNFFNVGHCRLCIDAFVLKYFSLDDYVMQFGIVSYTLMIYTIEMFSLRENDFDRVPWVENLRPVLLTL